MFRLFGENKILNKVERFVFPNADGVLVVFMCDFEGRSSLDDLIMKDLRRMVC